MSCGKTEKYSTALLFCKKIHSNIKKIVEKYLYRVKMINIKENI